MKTWCDDAITGVKQREREGGGAESKTEESNLKWFLFFTEVLLDYNHRGVFFVLFLERDPTHPLTPLMKML